MTTALLDTRQLGHSTGEIRAMVLHGVLRPVLGPLVLPWGVRLDADARWDAVDQLVGDVLPASAVLSGDTAAWLCVGGGPPSIISVAVPRMHRTPACTAVPLRLHDDVLADGWVLHHGSLACTAPVRTVVELLMDGRGEAERSRCRQLLRSAGLGAGSPIPAGALDGLSDRRRRAVARGWERLHGQAFR